MHVRSFTSNKLNEFLKEIERLKRLIKDIENTSVKEIWISELESFKTEYENMMIRLRNELEDSNEEIKNSTKKTIKKKLIKK